jgi:hypothetical protein
MRILFQIQILKHSGRPPVLLTESAH